MIWYPNAAAGWWNRASPKHTTTADHMQETNSTGVKQSIGMMQILAAVNTAEAAGGEGITAQESDLLWQIAMRLRLALFPEIFADNRSWRNRVPALSVSGRVILNRVLEQGFALGEQAAVSLANRLLFIGALCGASGPAIISPSETVFYRFAVDRYAQLASGPEQEQLMVATRIGGAMASASFPGITELTRGMRNTHGGMATTSHSATGGVSGSIPGFSGGDVVDWLVTNGIAARREGASATAAALVRSGAFSEVLGRRNFVDDRTTRYSFAQDIFSTAVRTAFTEMDECTSAQGTSLIAGATINDGHILAIADALALRGSVADASEHALPCWSTDSSVASSNL